MPCRSIAVIRLLAAALGVGLLWAPRPAAAQIAPETRLDSRGYASTLIHNHGADIVDVVIELRHGSVTSERIDLGEPVDALVSPARFALAPGETQTIRLLVREALASGAVVRLVTTITPRASAALSADAAPGEAEARLTFATRLITKVVAE